jgi:hypothetical protein
MLRSSNSLCTSIKERQRRFLYELKSNKILNITKRWIFSRCVLYFGLSIALLLGYLVSSRGIHYVDSKHQKPLTQSRGIYPRRKNFSVRNHVLLPYRSTHLRDKKNSKRLFSLFGASYFVAVLTKSRHWSLIRLTPSTLSWRFALIFSSSLCLSFQNTHIQNSRNIYNISFYFG